MRVTRTIRRTKRRDRELGRATDKRQPSKRSGPVGRCALNTESQNHSFETGGLIRLTMDSGSKERLTKVREEDANSKVFLVRASIVFVMLPIFSWFLQTSCQTHP
jgi:hypothetical protein